MASIVSQKQDLFFDLQSISTSKTASQLCLRNVKDDIFLIGCFRPEESHKLDLPISSPIIRLGLGLTGWMNTENPRILSPKHVILYDTTNNQNFFVFSCSEGMVVTAEELKAANLETSQPLNIVYRLTSQESLPEIEISKVLENYRESTNWTDGKPLFLSGIEILSATQAKRHSSTRKKDTCPTLFDNDTPSLAEVKKCTIGHQQYPENALTSFDLFSGCGGLTKGFSMAGIRSIFGSDIDENCSRTFQLNFPGVPFLCKDITSITKEEVDQLTNNAIPDIIIGGPPCQGFSLANKRRNKIADDPRNRLFYGFVKFIDWYSPKAFVMENVKGLLSMQNGEVLKTIIEALSNAGNYGGYDVEYRTLIASDYGVPQNRERVILIGTRKDLNLTPLYPTPTTADNKVTIDEALSDLPLIEACQGFEVMDYPTPPQNDYQRLMRQKATYVTNHVAMRHTPRLIERFKAIKPGQSLVDVWDTHGAVKRGNPNQKSDIKFSQNNQRLYGDKPAPTIAASFQSNFIHPHLNRNFTAREGARLQSFPDDFIFEGMRTKMSWEKGLSQYQQIGNAVPVLLAKAIGESIHIMLNAIRNV